MRIIFDFDHTLFSAKKLYFAFQKEFEKLGVEEKLFQETFQKSKGRGRDYNPSRQFKFIIQEKPKIIPGELKKSFNKILKEAQRFLYAEVLSVLRGLKKSGNQLVLLSYGEDSFQPEKIKKSKIAKLFDKVLITRDISKTSDFKKIFSDDKQTIFVEDNPAALSKVKKAFPKVIAIRINRGEGKYASEKNSRAIDFSIKNLKELEKILKEL